MSRAKGGGEDALKSVLVKVMMDEGQAAAIVLVKCGSRRFMCAPCH